MKSLRYFLLIAAISAGTLPGFAYEIIIGQPDTLAMIPFMGGGDDATRYQCLYYQDEINYESLLTEIWIEYDVFNGTFFNYNVSLCHTSVEELSQRFDDNYDGNVPEVVASYSSYTIGEFGGYGWWPLGFQETFAYNNSDNLLLEITWEGDNGGSVDNSHWAYGGQYRAVYADDAGAVAGIYFPVSYVKLSFSEPDVTPSTFGRIKATFR